MTNLLPKDKLHYLSLTLDTSGLHTRVIDGAMMISGPLEFIVKNNDDLVTSVSGDLVATFEFSLKNFAITSNLEVEIEDSSDDNKTLTSILTSLIADPWNDMFANGKPLSDFEERLKMAGGILADTTAEFRVDGFRQGWLYGGFLMASEVHL